MDCSLPFTACNRRIYFSTLDSWTLKRFHQSMKSHVHNKGVRYVNLLPNRPYHYATLIPTCYGRKSLPILSEENSAFNGKATVKSSLVVVSSEERSIQQEQNNTSYIDNGALNLASDTFLVNPVTKRRLGQVKELVEKRWNWMRRPIHGIATLLHPLWKSNDLFMDVALLEARDAYLSRIYSEEEQMKIDSEISMYQNNVGVSFSRSTSRRREICVKPIEWWETYGYSTPHIRACALRILSQDCSSGACERNWSSYSLIHTKIRNRLKTTQLEKLVYCRANLRLLRKLKTLAGPMQLIALRTNAARSKLLKKLSEANQFGRHLQRQLYEMEESLLRSKNGLASMELEISALVELSFEVAKGGAPPKTRKINGKYIHSHLALRLKEVQRRLQSQVKDLDAMSYREVSLRWCGMAEQVEVMGSFDGWTRGQQMSPENYGSITRFNTTLKLVPARYEIKFLVDGEWRVSPELPTVGEGLTQNNVIIVQ